MSESPDHEVTSLLQAWSAGDEQALDKLAPIVYQELHRTAHRYMAREHTGHTLQTTALVNEVYLRLANGERPEGRLAGSRTLLCHLRSNDATRTDRFCPFPTPFKERRRRRPSAL
jgi:hypothetical protein